MKKFIIFSLTLAFISCAFIFSSCNSVKFLEKKVVYAKTDILQGSEGELTLSCYYFYQMRNSEKENFLKFSLKGENSSISQYQIFFSINQENYSGIFAFNPVSSLLTCTVNVKIFTEKSLKVKIVCGTQTINLTLNSIIPQEVISVKNALNSLKNEQPSLIGAYTDKNGNFTGDIILKLSIINSVPYYYVQINGENLKTIAFLLNAKTGKVLAVRNVKN